MNFIERGSGALRRVLERAIAEVGGTQKSLTVLSPQIDPYRFDTPAAHRDGEWVAEQIERTIGPIRKIHWRGLHYAIVSLGDARKPNGEIYRNTEEDWLWLSNNAGRAARWLGHIPFDRIIDARNAEPIIYRKARVTPHRYLSFELSVDIPDVNDIHPRACVSDFEGRQPYALIIFGEKTSLEDVLSPIARRFEADLYLPSGEISDTLLYRMARDGAEDGRPMVVFTLSDCDPTGHQMPVSIGRKLQALRDLYFNNLEFEIIPVALTVEQVRELDLPSTPLKETERRADRWRGAFGVEQTEIDALATLRPRVFEEIVESAIEPFFDRTLRDRVNEARAEWWDKAQEELARQIDREALGHLRQEAEVKLEELREAIEEINRRLDISIPDRVSLPAAVVPEPEIDEEAKPDPLVSSRWPWLEVTQALIRRKSYGADP